MRNHTYSGSLEFYTDPETGEITPEVRLGDLKTALWAQVLSTMANAFLQDAPLLLTMAQGIVTGELVRAEGEYDEDMVAEEEEDEDETPRTH